ncbi:MAG: cytidylate kinase-like family protein [Firmicutes bacterium]|nr:cytidylate kinase-like family protein [Bacillota bacterium]
MKSIITIGRQYGSGGREVGQKLAAEYGISYYDKELLAMASEKSGIAVDMFEKHDEKYISSFLYSLVAGAYGENGLPMDHKIFLEQLRTIKDLADKGPCVIIGRCADYALRDYDNAINIYLHGNAEKRVERAVKAYGVDSAKAAEIVVKTDKQRASYYNFYTGRKWGDIQNYDLTIDSTMLGIDNTVKLIKEFVDMVERSR